MDFANFWYSSGSASNHGHDAGDPIGQSLRFRGSQYLNGNFSATTFTFSYWVKRGKLGSDIQYFSHLKNAL